MRKEFVGLSKFLNHNNNFHITCLYDNSNNNGANNNDNNIFNNNEEQNDKKTQKNNLKQFIDLSEKTTNKNTINITRFISFNLLAITLALGNNNNNNNNNNNIVTIQYYDNIKVQIFLE